MNSKKGQNIITSADFLRYRNGKMTGEERNAFERELQKDPFAEDASDGFSLISSVEAEKDMEVLRKQIIRRTGRKSYAAYFRIAAAIAVLVAISVIFLSRNQEQDLMLSSNDFNNTEITLDIAASEPITDKSETPRHASPVKKATKPEAPALTLSSSPAVPELKESGKNAEIKDAEEFQAVKEIAAVSGDDILSEEVKDSYKKMERSAVAGVSAPIAAKSMAPATHTPPQPISGIDSFYQFIEKNIHQIVNDKKTEPFVIISFVVNPDSSLTRIKILESPGQEYSREAKRLLREGPLWLPATENGVPVEEEYSIKILFR